MQSYRKRYPVAAHRWTGLQDTAINAVRPLLSRGWESSNNTCSMCEKRLAEHGWLHGLVCPGSWVVFEIEGRPHVMSEITFHQLYESLEVNTNATS